MSSDIETTLITITPKGILKFYGDHSIDRKDTIYMGIKFKDFFIETYKLYLWLEPKYYKISLIKDRIEHHIYELTHAINPNILYINEINIIISKLENELKKISRKAFITDTKETRLIEDDGDIVFTHIPHRGDFIDQFIIEADTFVNSKLYTLLNKCKQSTIINIDNIQQIIKCIAVLKQNKPVVELYDYIDKIYKPKIEIEYLDHNIPSKKLKKEKYDEIHSMIQDIIFINFETFSDESKQYFKFLSLEHFDFFCDYFCVVGMVIIDKKPYIATRFIRYFMENNNHGEIASYMFKYDRLNKYMKLNDVIYLFTAEFICNNFHDNYKIYIEPRRYPYFDKLGNIAYAESYFDYCIRVMLTTYIYYYKIKKNIITKL